MLSGLKNDLVAGFSVFLLALPLCLGIAMASNFPPVSGIITAVVGGLVASFLGSAKYTIKGPAAGLIVIALGAVHDLGGGDVVQGYKYALAVGVVAAIIQILLAIFKQGVIAEIFPPSVIHGMLAAIGVIIVAKQVYIMMGVPAYGSKPLELLANVPFAMLRENPLILGIGLLSFAIAVAWPYVKSLSFIPSSLVILAVVIPISVMFNITRDHDYIFMHHSYHLSEYFLIHMPDKFIDAFQFPDFSIVFSPVSIKYIIMFALVGSIESLLTVCAVDSIAPDESTSDLNKDLFATGVGNLVASLLGGLPMISEVVRSKANVDYGATSVRANFFHGLFMLLAILIFPKLMNLIPLSALAALLVYVGLKLASPKEFIHTYKIGKDQFLLFIVTFLVTLTTDLLKGVIAGLVLKIFIHLLNGNSLKSIFAPEVSAEQSGNQAAIKVEGPLTFAGYLKVKKAIESVIKESNEIMIDLSKVSYIDHTCNKKLKSLDKYYGQEGKRITIQENPALVALYNHALATRKMT
jgi:MFS superfamily sulfate permease-like transporter